VGRRPVERLLRSILVEVARQQEAGARNQNAQHEHHGGGQMTAKKDIGTRVGGRDQGPSGVEGLPEPGPEPGRKPAADTPPGAWDWPRTEARERAFEAVPNRFDCGCGIFHAHWRARSAYCPE
jgi:hypothetical protein